MHIHEADLPMETQQLATDALVSWAAIHMKARTDRCRPSAASSNLQSSYRPVLSCKIKKYPRVLFTGVNALDDQTNIHPVPDPSTSEVLGAWTSYVQTMSLSIDFGQDIVYICSICQYASFHYGNFHTVSQRGKLALLAGSLRDWRCCRVGHAGHASLATLAACFELLGVFGVHLQGSRM